MKKIVNIVNFIRGVEPRCGGNSDLYEPVRHQIELLKKTNLKGTFLLQYDALLDEKFISMIKECGELCEVGIWFETVQPLVEAVGEKWNGRYPWDWYNDVGFLIGYEPQVRKKLIDECMRKFYDIFGHYPDSVGSWHIDAVSMAYLSEKYHISACCICREQIGTDGYTMQGAYYNQAYYPSRANMFSPASDEKMQISMPVFRMLGSDPIYAYDYQTVKYGFKGCPTLEPVYAQYGGSSKWCDWFFNEVFGGAGISFQYTQVGQENSFEWFKMEKGLEYQFELVKKLYDQKMIEVKTLGESGKWYKATFQKTPPSTLVALDDWNEGAYKSIWYSSCHYRVNLFWENCIVRFRDMYIFDENYNEKYLTKRCESHACEYRNLPVMDGAIYTNPDKNRCAGIYFKENDTDIKWDNITYIEENNIAVVKLYTADKTAEIKFYEDGVEVKSNIGNLVLSPEYDRDLVYGKVNKAHEQNANHNSEKTVLTYISEAISEEKLVTFKFDGVCYGICAQTGAFDENYNLRSENGTIKITVKTGI